MTSRQQREGNAKYQEEVLQAMLAEKHNKVCADCGTRGPTWASTNIGCFVCIRCSGIHRNLGTHISKVRSVSLDKWSKEQVDEFKQYGNRAVNQYYEERMDPDARPQVTDDYQMEQFIRAKYEKRRWAGRGSGPKVNSGSRDEPAAEERQQRAPSGKSPKALRAPAESSSSSRVAAPAPAMIQQQPKPQESLLFQPHVSAAPVAAAPQVPSYVSGLTQPTQAPQQPSMSKDLLMSLYAPQPMAPQHPGQVNPHGTGYNGAPNYNVHLPTQPMYYPQQQQMPGYGAMPQQQQPQMFAQYPQQQMGAPQYGMPQQQAQYYQPQQQQFFRTH